MFNYRHFEWIDRHLLLPISAIVDGTRAYLWELAHYRNGNGPRGETESWFAHVRKPWGND